MEDWDTAANVVWAMTCKMMERDVLVGKTNNHYLAADTLSLKYVYMLLRC